MIELKRIHKSYKGKSVLKNISLTIKTGEFFVLIGSSGCGKTTLLKSINRLNSIDEGDILINEVNAKEIPGEELPRQIGYVVQEGGLFPHMTVADNIALALKIAGEPRDQIGGRVDTMMALVNLAPDTYRNQYPCQLSGGQRQRVGVARAFAANPQIILMDEPFSALDPMTRAELQDEIHRLQKQFQKTIVLVTHDMDEAIKLADRICIIENGQVAQCDCPENILKHPANEYVERFIGKNRLWANPEYLKASDIMLLRPYTISKGRTVVQAVQIMRHHSIDSLLVTDSRGYLLGVVRMRDILKPKAYTEPVEAYISKDYISVLEDTSLKKLISTIDYEVSGILPVVSHSGTVLGYLTKSSLLATMSKQFVPEGSEHERIGTI